MALVDSLGTMSPEKITVGIQCIDRQLDSAVEPEDRLAKADAANMLMFISWRSDGSELLSSQIDRLASMLNDPSHLLSGPAALALQHIGNARPDVVVPILRAALKRPEATNTTGVSPGIAVILIRMKPESTQVVDDVIKYMRRSDLSDKQLINTIVGIDSSPMIPDALTAELVRCLDRPNERVKVRALVGIARSSQLAKDASRIRIQKMANDPNETAHVRRIAAEALAGQITENPDLIR